MKKIVLLSIWSIIGLFLLGQQEQIAYGKVEPGWPMGTPNVCKQPTDGFIDFENGVDGQEIESTIPGVKFTTTYGLNWLYADVRTGKYNAPYPYGQYATNGYVFAWLGQTGSLGRIDLTSSDASYLSLLVSTYSGLVLDAYDANGNFLATSGWASNNLGTGTFTRLTVEAPYIAYILIHDSGNYWLIDDICTNASGVPPVYDHVADLAISVIRADYTWGGKGYDLSQNLFVNNQKILADGYYFWNPLLGENGGRDFGTGLDCSGLNFWTYNRTYSGGDIISWNDCITQKKCPVYYEGADGQYRANTTRINKTDLQTGDLLFFSTKIPGVMDHVAMYVDPFTYEGKQYNVIHASGFAGYVTPANYDVSTEKIHTINTGGKEQFLNVAAYGRIAEFKLAMEIIAHSPINLIVTDPNRQTVSIENTLPDEHGYTQEVPGLYYMVRDINGLGKMNDIVAIPELFLGSYLINPVPKFDALPTDTYSLEVIVDDVSIFLAENVPVSNIPSTGYGIEVTEKEIFLFIPLVVDIKPDSDPNCFNNNGHGVIPVAIMGKSDFDVIDIDPGTIQLNGLPVAVVGKKNRLLANYEDVNADGYEDLVVQIQDVAGAFSEGTTSASITGNLFDGTPIIGTDSICIVP